MHIPATREGRHQLIRDGITEGARITKVGGLVLVKCQIQIEGGKLRDQPRIFTEHAETLGLELEAMFHLVGHRAQPKRGTCLHCGAALMFRQDGQWHALKGTERSWCPPTGDRHQPDPDARSQFHPANNYSTLLVLRKTRPVAAPNLFELAS